ncbi:MAG: HNH endonuclease domain-containing protein [Candidatus Lokiarchaeota archaeon]
MTLIRDINNILEYGRKTSSYKFATLLGIFDYIIEHPTEAAINNFHFIPIYYLAKQFICYYYPFSFYNYYQASLPKGSQLKVIRYINKYKDKIKLSKEKPNKYVLKIIAQKETGIFWINKLFNLPGVLSKNLIWLLWKVRKQILDQPLQFLHNVKGEIIRFFGLINNSIPFNSDYDLHREKGKKQEKPRPLNWLELLEYEQTFLTIDDMVYSDLAKLRFWAREVILKTWYKYSLEGEKRKNNSPQNYAHLYNLLGFFYSEDISRDSRLISEYREFYEKIGSNICVYSEKVLNNNNFHIDHFLPWSYYPVNRFWNLYPAFSEINMKKSNLLPKWKISLERNIKNHLMNCLREWKNSQNPFITNDLTYFYKILQKNFELDLKSRKIDLILEELFNFIKKEWRNLRNIIPGKLYEFRE